MQSKQTIEDKLSQGSSEELQEDEEIIEPREDNKGRSMTVWRFKYSTKNIEQSLSESQDAKENTPPFQEFCKCILKSGKKNELVVCLSNSRSSAWFKQFPFIKQESLKQIGETRSITAQTAARELGPGYRILYNHNAEENNSQNEPKPSSQENIHLTQSERSERKLQELKEKEYDETEGSETEDEEALEVQRPNPKSPETSQQSNVSLSKRRDHPHTSQVVENYSQTEVVSQWCLRIFGGETVDKIRKDFVEKKDANLAWIFTQNFDLLMKAQQKYQLLKKGSQNLRKRQYEEVEYEEFEGEKPQKVFVSQDRKGGKKASEKEEEMKIKKVPKKKKEKVVKVNPTDHDVLSESISFYKSAEHFKKAIRSLSLFQQELAAFKETLTPEEAKIIEDAMDTGFNPIHYIYQYKIGVKTLANMRGALYKKCLNMPSLQLIYRYAAGHLQKKKLEEEANENHQENSQE